MEIRGYKSFNFDGTNVAGEILPPGKYHCDGEIKFGPNGNGYHFALRFEDTIRYSDFDDLLHNPIIAEVIGSGEIVEGEDNYNGYYDLYACSDLEVVRYLSREEIINMALKLNDLAMRRFVCLFKLSPDEILLFKNKYYMVDLALDYYQNGNKNAYRDENKNENIKKYVKTS